MFLLCLYGVHRKNRGDFTGPSDRQKECDSTPVPVFDSCNVGEIASERVWSVQQMRKLTYTVRNSCDNLLQFDQDKSRWCEQTVRRSIRRLARLHRNVKLYFRRHPKLYSDITLNGCKTELWKIDWWIVFCGCFNVLLRWECRILGLWAFRADCGIEFTSCRPTSVKYLESIVLYWFDIHVSRLTKRGTYIGRTDNLRVSVMSGQAECQSIMKMEGKPDLQVLRRQHRDD